MTVIISEYIIIKWSDFFFLIQQRGSLEIHCSTNKVSTEFFLLHLKLFINLERFPKLFYRKQYLGIVLKYLPIKVIDLADIF